MASVVLSGVMADSAAAGGRAAAAAAASSRSTAIAAVVVAAVGEVSSSTAEAGLVVKAVGDSGAVHTGQVTSLAPASGPSSGEAPAGARRRSSMYTSWLVCSTWLRIGKVLEGFSSRPFLSCSGGMYDAYTSCSCLSSGCTTYTDRRWRTTAGTSCSIVLTIVSVSAAMNSVVVTHDDDTAWKRDESSAILANDRLVQPEQRLYAPPPLARSRGRLLDDDDDDDDEPPLLLLPPPTLQVAVAVVVLLLLLEGVLLMAMNPSSQPAARAAGARDGNYAAGVAQGSCVCA